MDDNTSATRTDDHPGGAIIDMGEFVRGMAHEIANPFNTISMNVELVKHLLERNQTARANEVLERLLAECIRCGRLLRGMQRFGSALHAQERTVVNLRSQVDSAIALAQEEMPSERMAITITQTESDLEIFADASPFQYAIAGLLHNAAEAGAKNIHIDIRRDVDDVVIDFGDDGSGIAEEIRTRVTEAFFSTRRLQGNCGLGLTLVRNLVVSQGGSLNIGATRQLGALVSLRLPLRT